jgi:threonine dehydrogenase-like Zn-dependent dehydrogenase
MDYKSELLAQIESHTATVGVIGLGYVGLPLALAFAARGFPTLGIDIDAQKIELLSSGRSYIDHIPVAALREHVGSGRLTPCSDFDRLHDCDAILICVPSRRCACHRSKQRLECDPCRCRAPDRPYVRRHRETSACAATRSGRWDLATGSACCRRRRSPPMAAPA